MQEHFHNTKKAGLWAGHDAKGNKQEGGAAEQAAKRGLNSDGHGMWLDNAGNPVAKTVGDELVDLTPEEIKRFENFKFSTRTLKSRRSHLKQVMRLLRREFPHLRKVRTAVALVKAYNGAGIKKRPLCRPKV